MLSGCQVRFLGKKEGRKTIMESLKRNSAKEESNDNEFLLVTGLLSRWQIQ